MSIDVLYSFRSCSCDLSCLQSNQYQSIDAAKSCCTDLLASRKLWAVDLYVHNIKYECLCARAWLQLLWMYCISRMTRNGSPVTYISPLSVVGGPRASRSIFSKVIGMLSGPRIGAPSVPRCGLYSIRVLPAVVSDRTADPVEEGMFSSQ